jgi:hypothetical protein
VRLIEDSEEVAEATCLEEHRSEEAVPLDKPEAAVTLEHQGQL